MSFEMLLGTGLVTPDDWIVVLITPPEELGAPVYKIFSGWRFRDEWRLSSGTEDLSEIEDCGHYFSWRQSSGSLYHLHKNNSANFTEYVNAMLYKMVIKPARDYQFNVEFLNVAELEKAISTAC